MSFSIEAPTVVIFLEGANGTVLRNVVSTFLSAGRNIRVLASTLVRHGSPESGNDLLKPRVGVQGRQVVVGEDTVAVSPAGDAAVDIHSGLR